MGLRDLSGCALGLEGKAELPDKENWNSGHGWHAVTPQFIMLSPVIKWWEKRVPWEAKWLQHLAVNASSDDRKDCGVEWIVLSMLDYLPKENDKLMSFKLWCDHKASITTLKDSLTISLKIRQKFNCVGGLITVSPDFTVGINSSCARALMGKSAILKSVMGASRWIPRKQLEPSRHSVPPLPEQLPFCLKTLCWLHRGQMLSKVMPKTHHHNFQNEVKSPHFPKKQQGTLRKELTCTKKKKKKWDY